MKDFKDLLVWRKAHELAMEVYDVCEAFPKARRFEITAQMLRSSLSIPTNIAEGCGRKGDPEFRRFLIIAAGSANELEYLLLFARDKRLLKPGQHAPLESKLVEVRKMLASLIRTLGAGRCRLEAL